MPQTRTKPRATLPRLVEAFEDLDVLVIGDAILDVYLRGRATRLCREGPVPVVELTSRTEAPGGAANTAVNARSLGARVRLLAVVGDDPPGAALRDAVGGCGVAVEDLLVQPGRRSTTKSRVAAGEQLLARFDEGDQAPVDDATRRCLLDRLAAAFAAHDAVIVSDYGSGLLGRDAADLLARLQAETPRTLVIDARQLGAWRGVGATAVKPNYEEAVRLLGIGSFSLDEPERRAEQIALQGGRILDLAGATLAAVTLDLAGVIVVEAGAPPFRTYTRPRPQVQATGAGDSFTAAFTLALAAGADGPVAAELASAAAAIAVAGSPADGLANPGGPAGTGIGPGTAVCTAAALREAVRPGGERIVSRDDLAAKVALHRGQGRRIVFTNGCFDLLHRGHIAYLNAAKSLGDVLVVGVNSDASVRRLKGPERPLNPLRDRLTMLAALSCIDHLAAFDGDTADELIEAVRPDVFVKGGDYRPDDIPEAALVRRLGGDVQVLPYLEDQSTSAMIERIRSGSGAGSGTAA
jgi:D-beta-D-heptose 7-phosphate kinase/D-beta-D-heptose 1-phosphate adenosyltransferase